MAVDAVVFDIGNVLVEWNPERFFDTRIGPERRKVLFDAVDLETMNLAVDRGGDFATVVQDMARAHPEYAEDILLWHSAWTHMIGPAIMPSVGLLRAVRDTGTPVFALSNFGRETFEIAVDRFPFLVEFDRSYISGQMGVIKPEAEIYRRVEEDCGIAPEGLLFIDDKPENIATAEARGWQGHLFDGRDGLQSRLTAEGLL